MSKIWRILNSHKSVKWKGNIIAYPKKNEQWYEKVITEKENQIDDMFNMFSFISKQKIQTKTTRGIKTILSEIGNLKTLSRWNCGKTESLLHCYR